jgi:hypothetical protein
MNESVESIAVGLKAAKDEIAELGGIPVFTSGEWLFLLIQKCFKNYCGILRGRW